MDTNSPSGQLAALSFLVFWVLFAIPLFSAVRTGLGAGPSDDDLARAQDRPGGRITRFLNENARQAGAASRAIEARASSYFARRIGKIHLTALAFFAMATLFLILWNLHEVKLQRPHQIQVPSPSDRV
ncbi:hypothetical protein LAC81_11090 [Ensifer adhaerens]|uniref:hypothetical protein n=1 Tax=Ensifer adhaerens TaxID=106592 RepID=UPI001CBE60F5|nr:hypothetical protein [Ensifer adhaerens]MBZ7922330.1 hypothetical protein [Ensifer adhaerens]UAX90967.1 hypothetical protein LAC78_11085 [Ensifer adhaerens]UAX98596.1 hypothetical protein LAC80_11095 [Ensifer adhaerens]UAY05977.1 hypothetical protein LAC81_11090 [Ensifer adhaerens]